MPAKPLLVEHWRGDLRLSAVNHLQTECICHVFPLLSLKHCPLHWHSSARCRDSPHQKKMRSFPEPAQFGDKICQPWLYTKQKWADNITGMSSMENECNRLQWKTLPNTRAERKTMCCQRYVILHATRRSERTHLWVQDCRCKNTQTPATRLFGFLRNEVWW